MRTKRMPSAGAHGRAIAGAVATELSLVGRFDQVVALGPDRVALTSDAHAITYGELRERSLAIANVLRSRDQLDPPHVGLLFDQSIEAATAMLGTLYAGYAYVILEVGDPVERLRHNVMDASIGVLLTDERNMARAREVAGENVPVVGITSVEHRADDAGLASLPSRAASAVATLIYTSGSTGWPKGVIQTDENILRYSELFTALLDLRPDDRLSLLYTMSFAAGNLDLFSALLNGATLCMYDTKRLGVDGAPAWLAGERVTVLHTLPTLFRYLADHPPRAGYATIRTVDLAGEAAYGSDVRKLRTSFPPGTRLIHRYAASEIWFISSHSVEPEDERRDGLVPVGHPPAGVDYSVLGHAGIAVADGEIGEIVVRSRYLSPGYWRRDELNAAQFSQRDATGVATFRSRDAGRRDSNGELIALGRLDDRVKIRGHSVEPAEVEARLRSLPGVIDAIVDVERTGSGADEQVELVGYVVFATSHEPPSEGLRRIRLGLARRLPAYMLPRHLRAVKTMPLTRTGKVDRKALRSSALGEAPESPGRHEPGGATLLNATERAVADAFERALGVAVASREDDFFVLGGTSMTLALLQADLRRTLGRELELAAVVRSATVSGIAASIASAPGASDRPATDRRSSLIVPLRERGHGAPLYLVHGWHGQAFVTPAFLDAVPEAHPVFSIQARGLADACSPHRSVRAMAREYLEAIQSTTPGRRPIVVGICAGGVIAVEMARQASERGLPHLPLILLDPPFPPYARRRALRLRDLSAFYLGLAAPRLGPASYVTRRIARRLRSRAERVGTPDLDTATIETEAAIRVALSVGIALRRHRVRPYDGGAHVIASRRRLSDRTWGSHVWERAISGRIELVGAGGSHLDVLSASSMEFRAALASALSSIADEAAVTSTAE